MKKMICAVAALAVTFTGASAFAADKSSARQKQERGTQNIPVCGRNLGTVAIVEPENQWWREYSLGSPEAILRVFVQRSRCFTLVNRGRSLENRAMERALADNGELQRGSNIGRAQVKAAGCAGYLVSFLGRRVVYYGRSAETHVEHFPS